MPTGSSSSFDGGKKLEALCSVVIHPDQILRISFMNLQAQASTEPFHAASDPGGEDVLPQRCQEQLWEALDRKLEEHFGKGPASTSNASENTADLVNAPPSLASGSRVSLFKRAKRLAFSPESVNRRASTTAQHDAQKARDAPKKRRKINEHLSPSQLHERARAAAVDGEIIRAAARELAAAAAASTQPAQDVCSEDEHEDAEPQGTVTRVLRGLQANAILTGNMPPSQHQRWKVSVSQPGTGLKKAQGKAGADSIQQRPYNNATAASGGGIKGHGSSDGCLLGTDVALDTDKKQPVHDSNAVGSSRRVSPDCHAAAKLSEEERRARKRVKKQRQKQAAALDPARKVQEKEKRAKRRSAKKALEVPSAPAG